MGVKAHSVYWLIGVLLWTLAVVLVAVLPAWGQGQINDPEGDSAATFDDCGLDGNYCQYRVQYVSGQDVPTIGLYAVGDAGNASSDGAYIASDNLNGVVYPCVVYTRAVRILPVPTP